VTGLAERVVEVICDLGPQARQRWLCGSGLLISDRLVLTAAHAVTPGGDIVVRRADKVEIPVTVLLVGDIELADLAILALPEPLPQVAELRFAAVRRGEADQVSGCCGIGYPQFQATARGDGPLVRDTAQLDGVIPTGEQRVSDLLTLRVTSSPRALPAREEALGTSQWSGISGTVVVTAHEGDDVVVGVVTEHHPRAGESALTLTPITHIDRLPDAQAWWQLLGVTADRLVSLPSRAGAAAPAYRATIAEVAARTPSLLERSDELAALAAFATSDAENAGQDTAYKWITGSPWAGKTALAAHLASRPPQGVDCVAYLLQRRVLDASGSRFLAAVSAQLAYLLGQAPPEDPDAHAFAELWDRAVQRAQRLERHLLLVVDGLDEDLRPHGERSVVSLLPAQVGRFAHVLVTSRRHPGLPDDLDPDHLLWQVESEELGQVVTAARIEQRAAQELRTMLDDARTRRLLGLLAAAAGPMRTHELAAIDRADAFEVEAVLRDRAGRVLDGFADGWRFAHQTLLDQCRDVVFGPDLLRPFIATVDAWADQWRARQWPLAAPRYLIEYYPWALLARREHERLAALVTDPLWLDTAIMVAGIDVALVVMRAAAVVPQIGHTLRLVEVEAHQLRSAHALRAGQAALQLCLAAAHRGVTGQELRRWQQAASRHGGVLIAQWTSQRASPALLRTLDLQSGQVQVAHFVDDATVLTGDEEGRVSLWDVNGGSPVQLGRHYTAVHAAALDPTSTAVLTCGSDQTVRLHHRDGTPTVEITRSIGQVWAVAFAPDGRHIATAGQDATVRVWDLTDLTARVIGSHKDQVRGLAYSPDGTCLFSAGRDRRLHVWYLRAGGGGSELGHDESRLECLAVTPDGRHAVTGSRDGMVRLWPVEDGDPLDIGQHAGQVWTVTVSPDGDWVISGGGDGQVMAWPLDPRNRHSGGRKLGHHHGPVRCVSVSPDGSHVVSSSADGAVRIWDLHASDDPADGRAPVTAVAVTPGGRRIVVGYHSGEVIQYAHGQPRFLGDHGTPVRAVAAGDRHVLTSGDDGRVRQWMPEQATLGEHGGRVRSMILWEAAGLVLCGGSGGRVSVWPLAGGPPRIIHVGSEVMAIAATPDGTIVSGHGTGNVRVVASDGQIRTLRSGGAPVWAVALDADGRYAVSGDRAGQVLLWRLSDGECSRLGEHRGAVSGLAFSVDSRIVISVGEDGVRGWDVVTRAEVAHVSTEPITALAADGEIVATISATLGVTRWLVGGNRPTA